MADELMGEGVDGWFCVQIRTFAALLNRNGF